MNLNQKASNVLSESFSNLQKRQGNFTTEEIEAEVINQACKYIIENHREDLKSVHDINQINSVIMKNMTFQPYALSFINAASKLFPHQYGEAERKAAFNSIYSNISWAEMWDYLRDYFLKKHGTAIDNVTSEPCIFYSQRHERFEQGFKVSESDVERNVNVNFFNDRSEVIISIEPTLSAKKAHLVSSQNGVLNYTGADPDYLFELHLDTYDEIEHFILELPNRHLKIHYD
ncbi:hypothetical protein [Saccharicrinis sp. 156]|uniref:hypothetical protein n=1 Tax=Saccharicrinis sp. 156 TaxID=3417574 RepID=UPI003D3413C9